jgi:hypothetical protein
MRPLIGLALVVALQFLAGHAQTWFYSLCSVALYGLWEGAKRGRNRPSSFGRWLLLGVGILWGVALAAIQFLPTLELSRIAQRSADEGWRSFALQYSMWPWRLITLLLPDFFGNPAQGNYWGYATYWEDAGYVGVLPFLLALLSVIVCLSRLRARRHKTVSETRHDLPDAGALQAIPFFALLALFSLLMALGSNTPVYLVFYRFVPGFASFQAPARWLGVYTAAIAVLAGAGIDALRPSRSLTVFCRLGVVAMAQIALVTLLVRSLLSGVQTTFSSALLEFSVLGVGALLLLLWGQNKDQGRLDPDLDRRERVARTAWVVVTLALISADLIYAGHDLNPAIDACLYERQTEIGTALGADGLQGRTFHPAETERLVLYDRFFDFAAYGPTRSEPETLAHWWNLREALIPDLGMVEHLPSANSAEPLVQARYRTLLQALEAAPPQIAQRTLGLMNVAYLLSSGENGGADIVHRSPSVTAYRNPSLRQRAYVAHKVEWANSPEDALARLQSPTFDPSAVILESPQAPLARPAPADPHSAPDSPVFLPSPPNRVTIQVGLAQPGYLVLMDAAYPGWRVYVDGQRADLLRANYAFRAVALGTGDHRVVFRYQPASLVAGTILSGAALFAVVIAGIVLSQADQRDRMGTGKDRN